MDDRSEPRDNEPFAPGHRLVLIWLTLPTVMRVGFVVVVVGFAIDVLYHLTTHTSGLRAPCCGVGFIGHAVTLVGMLVSIAGIFEPLLRPSRRHDRERPEKGGT